MQLSIGTCRGHARDIVGNEGNGNFNLQPLRKAQVCQASLLVSFALAMGSGASFPSQVQESTVADLRTVVANFSPDELEKVKVALEKVGAPQNKARRRVKCGGKTFAPFGMRTDITLDPMVTEDFKPYKANDKLPEKVDLRKYMSSVEDQAETNSCCANALAGAYEYINQRHAQQTGDVPGDISRLFIYYVGRKKDMESDFGHSRKKSDTAAPKDEGMSVSGAISAMQSKGACLAESWPYDLDKVNEKPPEECFKEAQRYKVSDAQRVPVDLDMMRQCLAEGHPIVFGLQLTERFFRPSSSGFIPTPNRDDPQSARHGLHAMLAVGYNDRKQVFIVGNSWGATWGDGGYCYLPYDYVACFKFNICQQFAIRGLTNVDFTPDADDGQDPTLEDDGADIVFEEEDLDEEEDREDGFSFTEEFKGDRLVKEFFLGNDGVLTRWQFALCLSQFGKREGGKNFDALAFDNWMDDDNSEIGDTTIGKKTYWTPKDFDDVLKKFWKEDFAARFPGLAFLQDQPGFMPGYM